MFEDFGMGFFIGAVIVLAVFGLMLLRPAPPITTNFGGKKVSFTTRVPVADAFRAVANLGPGHKFTAVKSDESMKRVLLGDGFGWTSWGFYYPVDFIARPDGSTEVQLGIRSKAFQWGPLVTRSQNKMLENVRSLVEGARRAA